MSLEDKIDQLLSELQRKCDGDLVDHTSRGLWRFFPNKGYRIDRKINPSLDNVGLLSASCPDPDDLSQSPSCRFPNNINNVFSKGLDITKTAISTAGKVADYTEQAYVDEIVGYLEPIGISLKVASKVRQLLMWTKTRAHLLELRIIYELATEAGAYQDTLEAISYAVDRKETEKNRRGVQGLIPLLNPAIKLAHSLKSKKGKEKENDLKIGDQKYYAAALARNAAGQHYDPWAQWTVRCLLGDGWKIDQNNLKKLTKRLSEIL